MITLTRPHLVLGEEPGVLLLVVVATERTGPGGGPAGGVDGSEAPGTLTTHSRVLLTVQPRGNNTTGAGTSSSMSEHHQEPSEVFPEASTSFSSHLTR